MADTAELVSFLIAARNAEAYIEEAVESLLAQTHDSVEIIVCDDGSTDGTLEKLRGWSSDPRVVVLQNVRSRGAAYARNRCLEVARGRYIAIQDADDRSVRERAAKQVQFLKAHAEFAMVGGQSTFFDQDGTWGSSRKPAAPLRRDLLFALPFVHASLMIRAEVLREVGGYRIARETRRAEDYDLVLRIYAKGYRGASLPESVYEYRVDADAVKRRRYRYRVDEALVRSKGFRANHLGWRALPYVVKPLVVGLVPRAALHSFRRRRFGLEAAG